MPAQSSSSQASPSQQAHRSTAEVQDQLATSAAASHKHLSLRQHLANCFQWWQKGREGVGCCQGLKVGAEGRFTQIPLWCCGCLFFFWVPGNRYCVRRSRGLISLGCARLNGVGGTYPFISSISPTGRQSPTHFGSLFVIWQINSNSRLFASINKCPEISKWSSMTNPQSFYSHTHSHLNGYVQPSPPPEVLVPQLTRPSTHHGWELVPRAHYHISCCYPGMLPRGSHANSSTAKC